MGQVGSKSLQYQECVKEARFTGWCALGLLIAYIIIPIPLIRALVILGVVAMGSQFVFYGATAVSIRLTEPMRTRFQIAVALAAPAILSLYFIKDASVLSLEGMIGPLLNAWYLFPIAVTGYVSWGSAELLHREHPFRGYLIATGVVFFILYFGYHGVSWEHYEATETSLTTVDAEAARNAAQTGRYFAQFLLYVATSYVALFLKYRRNELQRG